MTARFKAWVSSRSLAGFESQQENVSLFLVIFFVLPDRNLCDGPIPRPEESYKCLCVSLSVIKCKNNSLHLKSVGGRGKTEKESSPFLVCVGEQE